MTSSYCSPRRPEETLEEFGARVRRSRDQWRQEFIGAFEARKESRLPSPYSDSDMDDEIMEAEVNFVKRSMLIEAGLATMVDFIKEREPTPLPPGPHGKSLSELDPEERESMGLPPRHDQDGKRQAEAVIQGEAIAAGQKRKRLPKDSSEQPPLAKKAKTTRRDTTSSTPRVTRASSRQLSRTQALNISNIKPSPTVAKTDLPNSKRKRASEEGFHELPLGKRTRTAQSSKRKNPPEEDPEESSNKSSMAKRRRTMPPLQSSPVSLTPRATHIQRRRRPDTQAQDAHISQQSSVDKDGKGVASRRKQKTVETEEKMNETLVTKKSARTTRKRKQTQRAPPPLNSTVSGRKSKSEQKRVSKVQSSRYLQPPPTSLPSRVTRARRCQLSGVEAQLLQLGQDDRAQIASLT